MASTSLYVKLIHVTSSPTEEFATPAGPLVLYITTPMDPLAAGTPCSPLPVPFLAGSTPTVPPAAANSSTPTGPLTSKDDHYGAMLFIVATVCVYGLSIIFFIAGHTQKREVNKDEEQQISHYLKRVHLDECSLDDRKFHVIRLKSELLAGSALGQRHNRRISLLRRPPELCLRLGADRREDDGENCAAEHPEAKDSNPDSSPLLNGECSVQNVNEEARSSPAPFRGRRFGCVGLSPAARESDSFGGERSRHHLLTCPLPDIQEDEVSTRSLDDMLSSRHHDPGPVWHLQSADPGPVWHLQSADPVPVWHLQSADPAPDTSPETLHASSEGLAQALSFSDSMQTCETRETDLDTVGSPSVVEELLADDDCSEAVMTTRL